MKVIPILPIDSISGKLYGKDSIYFRKSRNGKIYACRCPDRSKQIKTKAEERKAIVERMRKNGYTEEQIRIIIGDDKQE